MPEAVEKRIVGIEPRGDRVLVQRDAAEAVSEGGIVIPDQAQEQSHRGVVVASGPGPRLANGERSPMGLPQGQKVLFSPYSGTEVEWCGETYLLLREEDILAACFG